MSNKAVFLDRDNTVIEDPGYLADPGAVKLLPGVELAIKSLTQAGYKIVIVTNQSGIARGRLTVETLEKIHAEMQRQLAERGAHVDGIQYCPYHPEGTVEEFTEDSELRKPKPGMLLKAAANLDVDLSQSWMVGDSGRDIEAGQRAGCRTIRIRLRSTHVHGEAEEEDVQADHTVRNLVDAARVILRAATAPRVERAGASAGPAAAPVEAAAGPGGEGMDDSAVRQEILRHVRQLARHEASDEFSFLKLMGGITQMLAIICLVLTLFRMMNLQTHSQAGLWGLMAIALQLMALTCFTVNRQT